MDFSRFEQRAKGSGNSHYYKQYMAQATQVQDSELNADLSVTRIKNTYDVFDETEVQRLAFQRNLFRRSDLYHLSKLIATESNRSLVDVGCNDGMLMQDRLRGLQGISYVLGIDSNKERIDRNVARIDNGICDYACINAESSDFAEQMKALYGGEIVEFDIAFCSMVLLHTQDPLSVLQNLRYILKEGGKVFIRDIDDGLSVAYPDDNNVFPKILDLSNRAPATGFRHSGRQLSYLLAQAGYRNIRTYIENISTIGKSAQELDLLYSINFDFIPGDVELAIENGVDGFKPSDKADLDKWLKELKKLFHLNGFFYNMGSVVLTAEV